MASILYCANMCWETSPYLLATREQCGAAFVHVKASQFVVAERAQHPHAADTEHDSLAKPIPLLRHTIDPSGDDPIRRSRRDQCRASTRARCRPTRRARRIAKPAIAP